MLKQFLKRRTNRLKMYRISYTIMVNGENYPRSIDVAGKDEEDAKFRWSNMRSKSTSDEEYLFVSINKI